MVCLTDSELDCVIIAVRPLDVGARDALLRRRGAPGRRRNSASTFFAA
jgi:hypothetical protein